MKDKPKVISSEVMYDNWLKLRVDKLKIKGQAGLYRYDVVIIPGDGVAVLPFLNENKVLLAYQYRHPLGKKVLELIQGGTKKDESIEDAVARELLEETGCKGNIQYMLTIYPMPGSLDMRLHIFKAAALEIVQKPNNDPLEQMELVRMPYKDVVKGVMSGEYKDSALVAAVLYNEALRKR